MTNKRENAPQDAYNLHNAYNSGSNVKNVFHVLSLFLSLASSDKQGDKSTIGCLPISTGG